MVICNHYQLKISHIAFTSEDDQFSYVLLTACTRYQSRAPLCATYNDAGKVSDFHIGHYFGIACAMTL